MDAYSGTSYDRVQAIAERRISAAHERENMPERRQLVEFIESGRHLLLGAKAMGVYLNQRFTEDTDYLVDHRMFGRIRKWLSDVGINFESSGETIRVPTLAIDIIDAANNPVLKELLTCETGVPSREALAASKYAAIVSGTRDQSKVHFDIGDFIGLVRLEGFDTDLFLSFLVDRYEEQRGHARDIIQRIHAGEAPIAF